MKKQLLLFMLCFALLPFLKTEKVNAQDTEPYHSLIITEVRLSHMDHEYVELTNVGDMEINMKYFKIANFGPWSDPYVPGENNYLWLPDKTLKPGEVFLIANVKDYAEETLGGHGARTYEEIWDLADIPVHFSETTGYPEDSISDQYFGILGLWNGRDAVYVEWNNGTDSLVVDAVNNDINPETNRMPSTPRDVAGVPGATDTHVLVRKANVNQGNLDWESARGNDIGDSEWLPIPFRHNIWDHSARYFTTLKHHGDATLNEESVKSNTIDIDWANKKLTVPWGIHLDSIMDEFELGGGIAWHHNFSPFKEDSVWNNPTNNDTLTLYACGNDLEIINFSIEVAPATEDLPLAFPKNRQGTSNWYTPYYVTEDEPGMDTIGNVPFSTRIDTLETYIAISPKANAEYIWIDGKVRTDLMRGDIYKITAEDGSTVKEYYIDVDTIPNPSHNAHLAAITWPDVPGYLKESPDWHDDTIPNFTQKIFSYVLSVPYGMNSVPALTPHPANLNAQITVKRAFAVKGTVEDRTTIFSVAAEDDTTIYQYSVLFKQDLPPESDQPFHAEPFISQISFREWWGNNYLEIVNPGNRQLDLSKYMVTMGYGGSNPAEIIQSYLAPENWVNRHMKYVPGNAWQEEADWQLQPGLLAKDFAVNPMVDGGEVFIIGRIGAGATDRQPRNEDCDVIFTRALELETEVKVFDVTDQTWDYWMNWYGRDRSICLFKILNDSINAGTKPVGDPADFKLIEVFGDFAGSIWTPGTDTILGQGWNMKRKPEFWEGDTVPNASFAETDEESEWEVYNEADYINMGYGYPDRQIMLGDGVGAHPMNPTFVYVSTVSSFFYRVSEGFDGPQSIEGVITGTSGDDFITKVFKSDEGQTFEIISGTDGSAKDFSAELMDKDTLKVTSSNGQNVTKYALSVAATGLSDDAVLTSNDADLKINIDGTIANITGITYSTTIEDVVKKVIVPQGAILSVIDEDNNLVPMKLKNFKNVMIPVMANESIYLEVMAENGVTIINYQ